MDVAEWLRGLELDQYAPVFRADDIDGEVLRRLTAEDLRELGVASITAGGCSTRSRHLEAAGGQGVPDRAVACSIATQQHHWSSA